MSGSEEEWQETSEPLRVEKAVYGGDGLARAVDGEVLFVPFVLPGELVQVVTQAERRAPAVLEGSPDRVEPPCVHFGVCGGCQYQMATYRAQLGIKAGILRETLGRAGLDGMPETRVWASPDEYGYRNRIRLRVREEQGVLRMGYSVRGTKEFLPVTMCPIAAPVLWSVAEALMQAAAVDGEAAEWMRSADEAELFCDEAAQQVQVQLLCLGTVPQRKGSFERFLQAVGRAGVPVRSAGASQLHVASGRAGKSLAAWGPEGLTYRVGEQSFWLRRGNFFQVNRLLLPEMVHVVCGERTGALAWDLFAGVGLFARELARRFEQVTAVEANPAALGELQRGLRPGKDAAVGEITLTFLRRAAVQRERPELVVLDPPRAGAGEEACKLLLRLAPREIVYVSCDPTTLARDLRVLVERYEITEAHLVDLFPQTYHLETVMVLHRRAVRG